ncbi:hypothetical protein [Parachlamydia sp. AcF125]|uniref:hypothetical protein n=1 Tax=Parachlamydia sp. AcF125 TaxID=2795736 RepID=UPI001BC8F80E|nr:hypothetical protein [Parachlamydia sp. AcF125]MBS4168874.1 hypothetical protein [Parachlamydia sp. AcF125]
MDISEVLGVIIWMFAAVFLFVKKVLDERRRRSHPDDFQLERGQEARAFQELRGALDVQVKGPAKKNPPKPISTGHTAKKSLLDKTLPVASKEFHYPRYAKNSASRAKKLVRQASSAKDMILYHEILGKPKGYERD